MTSKAEIVPQGEWKLAKPQSRDELSVEALIDRLAKVKQIMRDVMKEDVHYGTIPGVKKPSLYQPGAQTLLLTFRLDPQFESFESRDGVHLTVKSKCTLYHIPTGDRLGSGEGSCSTRETKYAYRNGQRACPNCGSETIFKSKHAPRGRPNDPPGWFCWASKGGCGFEFRSDDPKITEQNTERSPNPDLPDTYNTVLKMSNKRALVAATLNVTAASDVFTQDLEDLQRKQARHESADTEPEPPAPKREAPPAPTRERARQIAKEHPEDLPPPRPPRADPPEAGFGTTEPHADAGMDGHDGTLPAPDAGQRYGPPLDEKQIKALHAKIGEVAKRHGLLPDAVKRHLLIPYGTEHSSALGQDVWNEINRAISKFRKEDLVPAQAPEGK